MEEQKKERKTKILEGLRLLIEDELLLFDSTEQTIDDANVRSRNLNVFITYYIKDFEDNIPNEIIELRKRYESAREDLAKKIIGDY
jgi:hypothetical protein